MLMRSFPKDMDVPASSTTVGCPNVTISIISPRFVTPILVQRHGCSIAWSTMYSHSPINAES